nr:retrovirus-related Pol polyprotein from transposon TNT 1-94 [Tanacetum cinerariifolium]
MISYDQYVKDNEVPVVHSDASSVPTDAFMMIYNDTCEPPAQSVSNPSRNTVVKNSLTAELAIYKEQVELYERWAKFEVTEREQKINEQLRLIIADRNFKEETLKKEFHSIKLQLASIVNHNKSMVQENGVALDVEQLLFLAGGQDNTFDNDVDEQPVQDLAINIDNVFQADDCDAFDSDVDEAPTT